MATSTALAPRPTMDQQLVLNEDRVFVGVERQPLQKLANADLVPPPGLGGSLIVKFRDDVMARCVNGVFVSLKNVDLTAAQTVITRYRLRAESLLGQDFRRLERLEDKVATYSGRQQPDLGGLVKIMGPKGRMAAAARDFNALDIVEYVEFEAQYEPASMQAVAACCIPGPGNTMNCVNATLADCISLNGTFNPDTLCGQLACAGACCYISNQAEQLCQPNMTPQACAAAQGLNTDGSPPKFQGFGSQCAPGGTATCIQKGACCFDDPNTMMEMCLNNFTPEDCLISMEGNLFALGVECDAQGNVCDAPGCGDETAGNCYLPTGLPGNQGGLNSPFCDQGNCCQAVCQIAPECCDDSPVDPGDWDEVCASIALALFSNPNNQGCIGPEPPPFGACETSGLSCFQDNTGAGAGCSIEPCCRSVCFFNPDCCNESLAWDSDCADLANTLCLGLPAGPPTPDLSAYQGYLSPGPWDLQDAELTAVLGMPPCDGANLDTGFQSGLGFFAPHLPRQGFTGEGFNIPALENVSLALIRLGMGNIDMARGAGIRVGVLDQSAYVQNGPGLGIHEDLAGLVTIVPSTATLLPDPITEPDHGTAVLGIIGANDSNGIGMNGMAPRSSLYFFPAVTLQQGGRIAAALTDVTETFDPGDVLCIPLEATNEPPGRPEGSAGCDTFVSSGVNHVLVTFVTDAGINVVIPAGNNSCLLDGIAQAGPGDCGAIIVGASTPGLPFNRIGASNHCNACDPLSNVHVNAWGANVATLGFGDLFGGGDGSGYPAFGNIPPPIDPSGTLDHTDDYTLSFGYTSAAAAQIAALTARLEGIAKQFYGMHLDPAQVRGPNGPTDRGLFHPNFLVGDEILRGVEDGSECIGDIDPQEDANRIGGFPEAGNCAAFIISGNHFGQTTSGLQSVMFLRGRHIRGNHFALASRDDNYLILESEYTDRNHSGMAQDRAAASVRYLASGQMVDIIVDSEAQPTALLEQLVVEHEIANTANPLTSTNLLIVEMYDWTALKWDFVDFALLQTVDTFDTSSALFNLQRFIRASDNRVKIRFYTIGLGGQNSTGAQGGGSTPYNVRFDYVNLNVGQGQNPGQTPGTVTE